MAPSVPRLRGRAGTPQPTSSRRVAQRRCRLERRPSRRRSQRRRTRPTPGLLERLGERRATLGSAARRPGLHKHRRPQQDSSSPRPATSDQRASAVSCPPRVGCDVGQFDGHGPGCHRALAGPAFQVPIAVVGQSNASVLGAAGKGSRQSRQERDALVPMNQANGFFPLFHRCSRTRPRNDPGSFTLTTITLKRVPGACERARRVQKPCSSTRSRNCSPVRSARLRSAAGRRTRRADESAGDNPADSASRS